MHRLAWLNPWMVFLTDFGLLFGVILFGVVLLEKRWMTQLVLVVFAFLLAFELSYLLKFVFETPRPYETWNLSPLKMAEGFSFPSLHAAFIFSALPFFRKGKLRPWRWLWVTFAVAVAWSRVYVGVHYVSDVLAGAMLGYGIGAILFYLEDEHSMSEWFLSHVKDRFELRRQLAHAFIGLGIVFSYLIDVVSVTMLGWILVFGGTLSVVARFVNVPGLRWILDTFERPQHRLRFPGKGVFFLVLGSYLCFRLFPERVALASIMVMALGDSMTNIFGRYFGEVRLPYNPRKTIDGVLVGIVTATLGAFYFVPLPIALVASSVAMFVETLDLKFGIDLDDNILVPLVAGGVMMLMGA